MLNRTLAASAPPRGERLRAAVPSLRQVRQQLTTIRQRSLQIQERVDRARSRCNERHGYGRHS